MKKITGAKMKLLKALYSSHTKLFLGIGVLVATGLVGTFQNFESVCGKNSSNPCRKIASIEEEEDIKADERTTLPSLVETINAIEDFRFKGAKAQKDESQLEAAPAIAMSPSELNSMGIIPGQKLEAEVAGTVVQVYAYASNSGSGIHMSEAAAKDLNAKVGDKVTVRQVSEALPKISEKSL